MVLEIVRKCKLLMAVVLLNEEGILCEFDRFIFT